MLHVLRSRRAAAPLVGLVALTLFLGGLAGSGCSSVPDTGRTQFNFLPESQELALGAEAYTEILKGKTIETGTPRAAMVERVGRRLAAVAGKNYAWEFKLVADDKTIQRLLPAGRQDRDLHGHPAVHPERGRPRDGDGPRDRACPRASRGRAGEPAEPQPGLAHGRRGRPRFDESPRLRAAHGRARRGLGGGRDAALLPAARARGRFHRPAPDGARGLRSLRGGPGLGAHGQGAGRAAGGVVVDAPGAAGACEAHRRPDPHGLLAEERR